mmetsp:Transcript_17360/g.25685  ORF Transcript_17360/g.25685 Transcript_17360/m.25685 type:complete len:85 (-) Transcript_17360:177-431(-)
MIGSLEDISCGTLLIDGKDVTDQPPSSHDLSMIFQSYALYPHRSVRDNDMGVNQKDRREKVNAVADILKLSDCMDRRPNKDLSG